MKISELIALLEQRKEEYGDVAVKTYYGGGYHAVEYVGMTDSEEYSEAENEVYVQLG